MSDLGFALSTLELGVNKEMMDLLRRRYLAHCGSVASKDPTLALMEETQAERDNRHLR